MKKKAEAKTEVIYIPKLYKNDDSLFVAVNGKRILIRKGEQVEVPVQFAEVIKNSLAAQNEAQRFIEASCRDN